MKHKFLTFIIVSTLALSLAGFWYYQKNSYSKEVLKLDLIGPSEAQLLDNVEYTVKYKNNGNVVLENAKLVFEYPDNSVLENGKPLRQEMELEDIYPGQEKTVSFRGRLLGRENEVMQAKTSVSYRPRNLKASYESQTSLSTQIKFIPLVLEFDMASKIPSGKEVKFSLNYFSSLDYPLSNLGLKLEYPSGFEFISSSPKSLDKTDWEIPILNKAEGGRVQIDGKLTGQLKEQKLFKATLGVWQNQEFIALKETVKGVEVSNPSISVFQQINGDSNYTANPGDLLHYEIFFRNLGNDAIQDLFLMTELQGDAFDFGTVQSDSQFNQESKSITWDWRNIPKLKFLAPGEEGKVEFWIKLKDEWANSDNPAKNFVLKNNVTLSQIKEEFETKINSKLFVKQNGYFNDEVFGNSGPIPPKVGETTTYTIIWQVKNYYNNVKNIQVKATLPSGAKLTGEIFPQDSKLIFDSQSREIIWNVGDLEAMSGVSGPAKSVSFQIAFIPAPEQRGSTPKIISEAKITGEDPFTEAVLESVAPAINTTLANDETITSEMGIVQ